MTDEELWSKYFAAASIQANKGITGMNWEAKWPVTQSAEYADAALAEHRKRWPVNAGRITGSYARPDFWFWGQDVESGSVEDATDADIKAERSKTAEPDWIPWSGGKNPAPGKRVECKLKSGFILTGKSSNIIWLDRNDAYDIIAYKIVGDA